MKFQTMGRDTHRFGRIALTVDANPFQKKLFITILEGRHLNGAVTSQSLDGHFIRFPPVLISAVMSVQTLAQIHVLLS